MVLRLCILFLVYHFFIHAIEPMALIHSTESDPDSFVEHCVNLSNGDYCETTTDLTLAGPDIVILQRYYSSRNYVTGKGVGGWRVLPQRFLVVGQDPKNAAKDDVWSYAFTGERSGGILTYSGKRNSEGYSQEALTVHLLENGYSIVNTHAGEISGQRNYQNYQLNFQRDRCELLLGDGTCRIYKKISNPPTLLLGEELIPLLAQQLKQPEYFLLTQEILPSGNKLFFSYDSSSHIKAIEMKNDSEQNLLGWIRFQYAPLNYLNMRKMEIYLESYQEMAS